jgi:hypothetical protein
MVHYSQLKPKKMKRSELTHRRLIHIKKNQSEGYHFDDLEITDIQKKMEDRIQKKREKESKSLMHEVLETSLTGL